MVHVVENMEASCVFYVKVVSFTHIEQSDISLVTVIKSGIVTLIRQYDTIVIGVLLWYPGHSFRQTSADVISLERHHMNIKQFADSGGGKMQFIDVTTQTTSN